MKLHAIWLSGILSIGFLYSMQDDNADDHKNKRQCIEMLVAEKEMIEKLDRLDGAIQAQIEEKMKKYEDQIKAEHAARVQKLRQSLDSSLQKLKERNERRENNPDYISDNSDDERDENFV
jgi:hypothetical protein